MVALIVSSCIVGAVVSASLIRFDWAGGFAVPGGLGLMWFDHIYIGAFLVAVGFMLLLATMLHYTMPQQPSSSRHIPWDDGEY